LFETINVEKDALFLFHALLCIIHLALLFCLCEDAYY